MISFLKNLFVDNWQRKLFSLIMAMIIWMVVNHSLSETKTFYNLPARVIKLPEGKTIDGLNSNGYLNKRFTVTITGSKQILDKSLENDLEILINAQGLGNEWITTVKKENLFCINPAIEFEKKVKSVIPFDIIVKLSDEITQRIPVFVTEPIGEPPTGYQYLDIWPYQLYMTVKGSEETVKKLKNTGLKLTFNLSDISRHELESQKDAQKGAQDEFSYFISDAWKKIQIPEISARPLKIDDPLAKALRIDFMQKELIPLREHLPVSIFYPCENNQKLCPATCSIAANEFIKDISGIKTITTPLYAKGVSRLFLETIKDMIQIVVFASPQKDKKHFCWNPDFIYAQELEDRYVSKVLQESSQNKSKQFNASYQEEYLRNRFRNYMHNMRLYFADEQKLHLNIEFKDGKVYILPKKDN